MGDDLVLVEVTHPGCGCGACWAVPSDAQPVTIGNRRYIRTSNPYAVRRVHEAGCQQGGIGG